METIKSYLENMFMNMKNTAEVKRAKAELLAMMEDKYQQLKAEGKSENEAIGIVISEFGNLQELAAELGIEASVNEAENEDKGLYINLEAAKKYMEDTSKASIKMAIGVLLCVCSPICLIILGGLQETFGFSDGIVAGFGLIPLLLIVACAVTIFIITGISLSGYERYKTEMLHMDMATEQYIRDLRDNSRNDFAIRIAIGVFLCIVGVIPVIVIGCIDFASDLPTCIAVSFLFAIVSIAVFLFVTAGMKQGCYHVLLQEEDYTPDRKDSSNPINVIGGIYWSIITAVYLIWSFVTMSWHITWIIWPVAGVLFGAISAICTAITGKH